MKKMFFSLIFILVLIFTVNYQYSKFDLTSNPSLSKATVNIGENYYLGYDLKWNSLIKPTLVTIEVRDTDGSVLDENHSQVKTTLFMDLLQHTGTLNESAFLEYSEKGNLDYVPVNGVQIDNANTLVLRINLIDEGYLNKGSTLNLKYRILGIPKQQLIELDSFLK